MMRIGLKNNHIVNKSTKFGRDNQSYYMIPTYTQLNGTMGQFGPMVLKYNKDFIMQCNTLTIKPVHVVLVKESSTYEYI